jgi:hypothetical protein
MKRIIFSVLIISVFYFGAIKIFAQCNCEPKLTVQEHFQRSDAVFVGKVIEAKKIRRENTDNYDIIIKFEVTQTWKQDLEKFVIIKEFSGSTDGFEAGVEWLLYAFSSNDGTLQITRNCCSRTKRLSVANKQGDLKVFKKMGEKPKKIINGKDEAVLLRTITNILVICSNESYWDILAKNEKSRLKGVRKLTPFAFADCFPARCREIAK